MIQDQNQQHVEVFDAENNGGEGKQSMSTLTWVLIGIGAAVAIGLLIWLIVASTKKTDVTEEEVIPWTEIEGKITGMSANSTTGTINGKAISKQVYEVEDNLGRRQIPKEQYEILFKEWKPFQKPSTTTTGPSINQGPQTGQNSNPNQGPQTDQNSNPSQAKPGKFIKIVGNVSWTRSHVRSVTENGKTVSKEVYEVEDDEGRKEVPKEQYEILKKQSNNSLLYPLLGLAGLAALIIGVKTYLF